MSTLRATARSGRKSSACEAFAPSDHRLWCGSVIYRSSRSTTVVMSVLAAIFAGFGVLVAIDVYRFERSCVRTSGRVQAHETVRRQNKYDRWVDHTVDVYEFTTQR